MSKFISLAILLWLLCASSVATATPTGSVAARECVNCTQLQMQTMAKNSPVGLVFIYDLAHNVMRKFDVYMDSTCGVQPVPQTHSGGGQQVEHAGGGGTNCGSFKAADEMTPVDTRVQSTFNALYRVYVGNPSIALNGVATRVGALPIDTATGHAFDPQDLAWQYPQGSYIRFIQAIQNQISTKAGANSFIPYLGDDMYDWVISSLDVGGILGAEPGVTFSLHYDRATTVRLLLYGNSDNDCVQLTVNISGGGTLSITYQGVVDLHQNLYPSQNGDPPGNQSSWHFRNGGGPHFANELRNGGVFVPSEPTCGYGMHEFMQTTRNGGQIISVDWWCVAN